MHVTCSRHDITEGQKRSFWFLTLTHGNRWTNSLNKPNGKIGGNLFLRGTSASLSMSYSFF
jgi:hypothetical protein